MLLYISYRISFKTLFVSIILFVLFPNNVFLLVYHNSIEKMKHSNLFFAPSSTSLVVQFHFNLIEISFRQINLGRNICRLCCWVLRVIAQVIVLLFALYVKVKFSVRPLKVCKSHKWNNLCLLLKLASTCLKLATCTWRSSFI